MAKKARKKMEEAEPPFEFPPFDEPGFVWKELELTAATALAGVFAVILGVISWGLTLAGIPWFGPFVIGVGGMIGGLLLIQRIRSASYAYTKGDWAGLFFLGFFGWLALWFVLVNLSPMF
ncbi:MAG: hypothetical protein ACLPZM_03355 [Thermoplasmata archaeon]